MDTNPRVHEFEESAINPSKVFEPDFNLVECHHIHTSKNLTSKDVVEIGEKAFELVKLLDGIHGIRYTSISKLELRVFKLSTHKWEELTPLVRNAFRQVYGQDIVFQKENAGILAYRRLKAKILV
jgi:hypothetical protein